jgi:2-dehydro-3-deoxyphosphogalactonate aldolase
MRSDLFAGGLPIVAILRGVAPSNCARVAEVIYRAGIRVIEVPLNSPDPFTSIRALATRLGPDCVVGAGTVLTVEDVNRTHEAGGTLVVAPNCDGDVIRRAVRLQLNVMPGFATPTEAFTAIQAGASDLKLFPAATYGPQHVKALRAVLPKQTRVIAVGGIGAKDIRAWLAAGTSGFGFGSELFRPDFSVAEVEQRARQLVDALHEATKSARV